MIENSLELLHSVFSPNKEAEPEETPEITQSPRPTDDELDIIRWEDEGGKCVQ